MNHRTVLLATYDDYLDTEYPVTAADSAAARTADIQEHQARLKRFPYSVVLQVSFPELDYANRWCWQQFGPAHGECLESYSQYPSCDLQTAHTHDGTWLTHWLAKTDYDFGFSEWCFAQQESRDRFLAFVPLVNWGERFPK
jgi:hypothetical protein